MFQFVATSDVEQKDKTSAFWGGMAQEVAPTLGVSASTVGIAFSDYSRIQKSQLAVVDLLRIY